MAKITLLTTNLARGGAELQVTQLALRLRRRGWSVAVLSLMEPSAFRDELAAEGVVVDSACMKPGEWSPVAAARLLRLLRRQRPQILHTHMFHANLAGRLSRLVLPYPVLISTSHSALESSRRSTDPRRREQLYRLTDFLSDATVCVCRAGADRLLVSRAVSPPKLFVIPNGVDTLLFHPDERARTELRRELEAGTEFVWLAAGRLMWKKGFDRLLQAFEQTSQGVLWIAGAGPDEASLRARAAPMGQRVRFLGLRKDMQAVLNACDAFVLSSLTEGLPLVLLEAAAVGKPVVAVRAGGAEEAILEHETGFLAASGDPEALAAAMREMQNLSPERRREMGVRARRLAEERFDWSRITPQWEALYTALLRKAAAGV